MAAGQQLADSSTMRPSPWRSCAVNGMPEEVELDGGPALDDREVVVERGYESAWPMMTRVGSAPSSSKIRSWASPTADRTPWVVIARPVRRAARAAARWTRSSGGETHGLSVPISPMIPGRTPRVADPVGRLARPARRRGRRRIGGRSAPRPGSRRSDTSRSP